MKIQIDIPQLKQKAKALLTANGSKFLFLSGAYVIICTLISTLCNNILLKGVDANEIIRLTSGIATLSEEEFFATVDRLSAMIPPVEKTYLLALLQSVISSILFVGFVSLILKAIRHQELSIGILLDGAPIFYKVILLDLCMGIVIFFSFLLFIVPGIIAVYAYSMSHHILADNPEKGVIQCMRESRRLMKGYKLKLFALELSFILWGLLSFLPIVGYIVPLWLTPYKETTRTLMYLQLKGENIDYAAYTNPSDILPPV